MGRFGGVSAVTGMALPATGSRHLAAEVATLLGMCTSSDARMRQLAVKNLCTCHVRSDYDEVWSCLFRLLDDPDEHVRIDVVHALTDSTPKLRVPAVVDALRGRYQDPDPRVRRRIHKILAWHRRTGTLSDAAS